MFHFNTVASLSPTPTPTQTTLSSSHASLDSSIHRSIAGALFVSSATAMQRVKMSRAAVELDFFGLGKENKSSSSSPADSSLNSKSLDRRRSFRGIQTAISKINPELLKSVFATEAERNASLPPLPVYAPFLRPSANAAENGSKDTAPLTIFYNGTVSVFDVSSDKAEIIMKLAEEAIANKNAASAAAPSGDQQQLLGTLGGDLPLFRRISLQRFLEKRKERLTSLSPYASDSNDAGRGFSKKKTVTTGEDESDN